MKARGYRGKATREQQAESIKEAVYLTFTMIAVLITAVSHGEPAPLAALWTLLVTAVAMCLTILTADVLSHLVVHDRLMSAAQLNHAARASFGSLVTIVLPAAILVLGAVGALSPTGALWAAIASLAAGLVAVGWLALRGTAITWWQRLLGLVAIAALAAAVVVAEVLAHG